MDSATAATARSNPDGWRAANGMFDDRPEWIAGGRAPLDENYAARVYTDGMAVQFQTPPHLLLLLLPLR